MMKPNRLSAAVFALALGSAFQATHAEIKPLNSIAVEVNSSIITYGDIERTVRELKSRNAGQNISEEQYVQAAKARLLERALLADAARQQNLKVTPEGIDAEIARRAAAAKTTPAALYAQAAKAGYTREAFRLEVAKDLLTDYLLNDLNADIKITDAQIDEAMAGGKPLPKAEPYTVYTIRLIALQAGNQENMPAVRKRMEQIAAAIEHGSDFAQIARRYSQEAASANGGLHEISDYMLPENVETLLHQLKPGQMTAPQRVGMGWQLIQLVSERTENNPAKMQREVVRRQLVREARQAVLAQFVQQLQQGAVVREY
nr:peptidylprolyl isomerase [uncultured Kingella sp.]